MPFDPNYPQPDAIADPDQMRAQLFALKALIDANVTVSAAHIDAVHTLGPGSPANVTVNLSSGTLHFVFDIPQGPEGPEGPQGEAGPQGDPGPQGPMGEVSQAQLADAIAGTSSNTNAVGTLDTPFANDPPTLADMEVLRAKMNEIILTARR